MPCTKDEAQLPTPTSATRILRERDAEASMVLSLQVRRTPYCRVAAARRHATLASTKLRQECLFPEQSEGLYVCPGADGVSPGLRRPRNRNLTVIQRISTCSEMPIQP